MIRGKKKLNREEIIIFQSNFYEFSKLILKKQKGRFYYTLQLINSDFNINLILWSQTGIDFNILKIQQWLNGEWIELDLNHNSFHDLINKAFNILLVYYNKKIA